MRPLRPPPHAVAVGVLAALLSGCTGPTAAPGPEAFPTPPAEAFASGTCSTAAPDVLEIGSAARDLGQGPDVDRAVIQRLQQAQQRLSTLADAAEPPVGPALDTLVTRVGLVRLAADAGRYSTDRTAELRESYDGVLAACTRSAPPPSSG